MRRILCSDQPWSRRAIEAQIFRLGAKSRATAIHLILATRQPSREVMRGALNANILDCVGLKTNNAIEFRMPLTSPGTELMLIHGDLLFKSIGEPVRLPSPYLPPKQHEGSFLRTGCNPATVKPAVTWLPPVPTTGDDLLTPLPEPQSMRIDNRIQREEALCDGSSSTFGTGTTRFQRAKRVQARPCLIQVHQQKCIQFGIHLPGFG